MIHQTFHLHALSALHVGTGQGIGVVDLPIARAKATHLPVVPGSSIKGVLRDTLKLEESDKKTLFGPKSDDIDNAHAGAIAFGDAHLLILPVRSFAGTVAYATSPFILRQYARDLGLPLNKVVTSEHALLSTNSVLQLEDKKHIALEDLDLKSELNNKSATEWANIIAEGLYPETTVDFAAWRQEFVNRFVILPDHHFSFLADTATEVRIRIKIDPETRVVNNGALWSEENLPAEAVLWGIIGIHSARDRSGRNAETLATLLPKGESLLQIGGKHTVGRGLTRFILNNKA